PADRLAAGARLGRAVAIGGDHLPAAALLQLGALVGAVGERAARRRAAGGEREGIGTHPRHTSPSRSKNGCLATTASIRWPSSEMEIRVPSSARSVGTRAIPITASTLAEKRALVTSPAAEPSDPTTTEPSVGTLPSAQRKPTSSIGGTSSW